MDIPYPTVGLSFITEKRVGLMDDWLRRERFVFLGWSGNGNSTATSPCSWPILGIPHIGTVRSQRCHAVGIATCVRRVASVGAW